MNNNLTSISRQIRPHSLQTEAEEKRTTKWHTGVAKIMGVNLPERAPAIRKSMQNYCFLQFFLYNSRKETECNGLLKYFGLFYFRWGNGFLSFPLKWFFFDETKYANASQWKMPLKREKLSAEGRWVHPWYSFPIFQDVLLPKLHFYFFWFLIMTSFYSLQKDFFKFVTCLTLLFFLLKFSDFPIRKKKKKQASF